MCVRVCVRAYMYMDVFTRSFHYFTKNQHYKVWFILQVTQTSSRRAAWWLTSRRRPR